MKFVELAKVFLLGGLALMAAWVPLLAYSVGVNSADLQQLSNDTYILERRVALLERPIGPRSVPVPTGRGPNIGEAPSITSPSP